MKPTDNQKNAAPPALPPGLGIDPGFFAQMLPPGFNLNDARSPQGFMAVATSAMQKTAELGGKSVSVEEAQGRVAQGIQGGPFLNWTINAIKHLGVLVAPENAGMFTGHDNVKTSLNVLLSYLNSLVDKKDTTMAKNLFKLVLFNAMSVPDNAYVHSGVPLMAMESIRLNLGLDAALPHVLQGLTRGLACGEDAMNAWIKWLSAANVEALRQTLLNTYSILIDVCCSIQRTFIAGVVYAKSTGTPEPLTPDFEKIVDGFAAAMANLAQGQQAQ